MHVFAQNAHCLNSFHAFVDDANNNKEAVNFNAEAHCEFFRRTFECFSIDFDEWVKAQTTDKVAINVCISLLSSKPTIPCSPHLLQSEINLIESLAL